MRLRRTFTYLVGTVSIAIAAVLTGGVAWQYPLTRLGATEISSGPKAFEDRKKILQGLLTMINYLSIAKTFEDRAYDLFDNLANKKQTDGPWECRPCSELSGTPRSRRYYEPCME